MIPIRNAVPSRYPPVVTWMLIATNCFVFLLQNSLGPLELEQFLRNFALIPARYPIVYRDANLTAADFLPFFTMMFLHGGWLHLILNMWTLWLFGPTVEDRLGYGRYLAFYLACGLAASVAHFVFNPTSVVPALGASGAIAGVLGSYMRLFPLARVVVLVPVIFVPLFFEVPAFVFAGLWFLAPGPAGDRRAAAAVERWRRRLVGAHRRLRRRPRALPTVAAARAALPRILPRRRRPRLRTAGSSMICRHRRRSAMSVGDLFWLFFMFTAIQPMLRQRMLDAMRMRKIAQLERQRNSRVILLVHRQETMRLLGFPVVRYIDINDSEDVLRAIQMTDEDVPLDIVLHTPGGLVLAALQIATRGPRAQGQGHGVRASLRDVGRHTDRARRRRDRHVQAFRIGPVDPQLGHSPAASLIKVVEQKPIARGRR